MNTSPQNCLHLDLKGIMPGHTAFLRWLEFFAACGFDGVVLEYEDRYPFESAPGAFRPGFSVAEWHAVHARCAELGLTVIPLVQTHGHLEWLLKHDACAGWREDGLINEICPSNAEAVAGVLALLDEVLDSHLPFTQLIHIGGDETWNLASCPSCAARAAAAADGKLRVYLDHLQRVCERVIARGARPLIWGDMFWREGRPELAAELPKQVILVDWQYQGPGPFTSTADLLATGREVWGASAIVSSGAATDAVKAQGPALANIDGWHAQAAAVAGLIHTTWARSRSLLPLYGPWHAWLPAFIAAGRPGALVNSPWEPLVQRLDAAMNSPWQTPLKADIAFFEGLRLDDPLWQGCVDFWALALRFRELKTACVERAISDTQYAAVYGHIGVDPEYINHARQGRAATAASCDAWAHDVRDFFQRWRLDSADEYVASRRDALLGLFPTDWAADLIPAAPPRSAR
jgi:hypothetical protein